MNDNITYQNHQVPLRERWIQFIDDLQNSICEALEKTDGAGYFIEDRWQRSENGGGGKSRIIENGGVFEKGGVNTSVVYGSVSDAMRTQLKIEGSGWFACGLSLVLHPLNPFVPTVHANWRYFELYDEANARIDCWFGGGTDLTPNYLFSEDANHFHNTLKSTLDPFGPDLYRQYKEDCDK
ncbi:MAG TPA: coproporphyrinogen III oxidase, partial [Puia sp.]